MDGACRRAAGCVWVALFWLLLPLTALAQSPTTAGVVTQVQGRVDLIRQATTPVSLQFKDELFLRDIVNTGEESMARMLFGGRSSVTVRELTRFEVRSEVLPTGGSKTVYDLSDGKIRVIVVPKLMKPGDEIEIRTPNAVAGIRGTVVVAEHDRKTGISRLTVVDDCAAIAPPGGASFTLCKGQRVVMTSSAVISVGTVSPAEMAALEAEFVLGSSHPGEANRERMIQTQMRTAQDLMTAVVGTGSDGVTVLAEGTSAAKDITADPRTAGGTGADITGAAASAGGGGGGLPPPPPPPKVNVIVNPGFETGDFTGWTVLDQAGSNGTFFIQAGAAAPLDGPRMPPFGVFPPPEGNFAAMTDSNAPGSHILYQDVVVVPVNAVLRFKVYVANRAATFHTRTHLFYNADLDPMNLIPDLNQQARVDIVDPNHANIIADPFAVGAGVILNLFQTVDSTDPTARLPVDVEADGYIQPGVFDLSALAGQNIRLRFAEVDNVLNFQFGVDDVSLVDPAFPDDLLLMGSRSFRAIAEPLVWLGVPLEIGTDSAIAADLLDIRDGGRIVMISSAPVVLLDGGPVIVGTADATGFDSPNRLFNIRGANIDPATGLGTDQPIMGNGLDPPAFPGAANPIGSLLEATDGTTIAVLKGAGDTAGGNALYLDTALLEASLPIIRLIGSATAQTTLTTDGSTIELFKSAVTALGPIVALDRGLITVQTGPLINLTDGSRIIVLGDLLSLINGSRINVLNGPLVSVNGAGSLLNVSGALVQFGGTGGNAIVVNNSIAPTAVLSGLPVSATTGGSIAIGPNPVMNPALGSISVNGSLISTTQGGRVNIAAP